MLLQYFLIPINGTIDKYNSNHRNMPIKYQLLSTLISVVYKSNFEYPYSNMDIPSSIYAYHKISIRSIIEIQKLKYRYP